MTEMVRDSLCQCIMGFHVTAKACTTEFPYVRMNRTCCQL